MSSEANIFRFLAGAVGDVGGVVNRRQASTQMSNASVAVSTGYRDFFRDLDVDPETDKYQEKFDAFTMSLQETQKTAITNAMAQQQFDLFFEGFSKGQATDRLYALMDRNSKTFGYQALINNLETLKGESPAPLTTPKEFVEGQTSNIENLVGDARDGGIVNPDIAAQTERLYVEDFLMGYSADMSREALNLLMGRGETMADAQDILEQVIRSEGEAYDTAVAGADLRLAELAEGYGIINLSPDNEEKLIAGLRKEAAVISNRNKVQQEEQAATNDTELAILWATGDRTLIEKDGYKMLFDMYPNDPASRNKWILDYGKWEATETQKAVDRDKAITLEKKVQGFTDRTEDVRVSLDLDAIDTLRDNITDADMPNTQRRTLLSTLATIRDKAIKEEDPDTLAYDTFVASLDLKILDLDLAVQAGNGDEQAIKELQRKIAIAPELIQQEQDREERVDELSGLLDDMVEQPDKNAAKVKAKIEIGKLWGDLAIGPDKVRDLIIEYNADGTLPLDDMNTLLGQLADREKDLGNMHAIETFNTLNLQFDALVRFRDNTPEETAALATDQITAFNMYNAILNDPKYRDKDLPGQIAEMTALINTAIAPAVRRSLKSWLGLSAGESAFSYERYQDMNESQRAALYPQIRLTLMTDLEQEFNSDTKTSWLGDAIRSTEAFGSRQMLEDDKPIIVYRHHETGLLFSKFGNNWNVKFPDKTEWERIRRNERERMEEL